MSEAAVFEFPQRPDDRLRLALRRLEDALNEQRDAVAHLRAGLRELDGAVGGLDRGLGEYRMALDAAAAEAALATAAARQLEATADAWAGSQVDCAKSR